MVAKRGYTLIEILVAVTIIAVLTAIGVVSYGSINKRSRDAKRKGDLEQIRSALEMYRSDQTFYPPVNSGDWGAAANLSGTLVSDYLPAVPADPQSPTQNYYYKATTLVSGHYYGYCVCVKLESLPVPLSTCTPGDSCNYGVKQP